MSVLSPARASGKQFRQHADIAVTRNGYINHGVRKMQPATDVEAGRGSLPDPETHPVARGIGFGFHS